MSLPKITQSALLEVLVKEVESLKKTQEGYKKILDHTTAHIARLEALHEKPMVVDTTAIEQAQERISQAMAQRILLPKSLLVGIFVVLLLFCISLWGNYAQYMLNMRARAYITHLEEHLDTIEEKVSKPKKNR